MDGVWFVSSDRRISADELAARSCEEGVAVTQAKRRAHQKPLVLKSSGTTKHWDDLIEIVSAIPPTLTK